MNFRYRWREFDEFKIRHNRKLLYFIAKVAVAEQGLGALNFVRERST